ncbi:hypothetical protein GCM10025771_22620 [Niveibacterium umoris]|uniref:Uncharacterized protein n=1 Tax=Niveibacterium umoris TaxID=1193620 RepID=A0A840BLZ2_9RHOO|nr:hypothetical protein [Niveibacterium umoris]MBB4012549.1 hypothetical protein [Niveibacterium umoris]
MSGRALRFALVAVALVALTWLCVVLWWQRQPLVLQPADVLLGLVAAPVAVCAIAALLWFGLRKAPAPQAAAQAQLGETTTVTPPVGEAWILGVGIHTAAGTSTESVCEAIETGASQPAPCDEIVDFAGLPVRLARVAELPSETRIDGRDSVLDQPFDIPESVARALALLPGALVPVLADLVAAMPPPVSAHAQPRSLPVMIRVVLPALWSDAEISRVQQRIERLIADFWSEALPPMAMTRASEGITALREIDAWLADTRQPRGLLLVALDSLIDLAQIETASGDGRLYRHDHPEGMVPGEAVTTLLLARPDMSVGMAPVARLNASLCSARNAEPRRVLPVDASALEGLFALSMSAGACNADDIAAVVCDGDVRPTRAVEVAVAMNKALPHLDPVANRLALGAAFGDLGVAGAALGLALAAHKTQETQKPTLFASLSDPLARGVALLLPYEPEPATT